MPSERSTGKRALRTALVCNALAVLSQVAGLFEPQGPRDYAVLPIFLLPAIVIVTPVVVFRIADKAICAREDTDAAGLAILLSFAPLFVGALTLLLLTRFCGYAPNFH